MKFNSDFHSISARRTANPTGALYCNLTQFLSTFYFVSASFSHQAFRVVVLTGYIYKENKDLGPIKVVVGRIHVRGGRINGLS